MASTKKKRRRGKKFIYGSPDERKVVFSCERKKAKHSGDGKEEERKPGPGKRSVTIRKKSRRKMSLGREIGRTR